MTGRPGDDFDGVTKEKMVKEALADLHYHKDTGPMFAGRAGQIPQTGHPITPQAYDNIVSDYVHGKPVFGELQTKIEEIAKKKLEEQHMQMLRAADEHARHEAAEARDMRSDAMHAAGWSLDPRNPKHMDSDRFEKIVSGKEDFPDDATKKKFADLQVKKQTHGGPVESNAAQFEEGIRYDDGSSLTVFQIKDRKMVVTRGAQGEVIGMASVKDNVAGNAYVDSLLDRARKEDTAFPIVTGAYKSTDRDGHPTWRNDTGDAVYDTAKGMMVSPAGDNTSYGVSAAPGQQAEQHASGQRPGTAAPATTAPTSQPNSVSTQGFDDGSTRTTFTDAAGAVSAIVIRGKDNDVRSVAGADGVFRRANKDTSGGVTTYSTDSGIEVQDLGGMTVISHNLGTAVTAVPGNDGSVLSIYGSGAPAENVAVTRDKDGKVLSIASADKADTPLAFNATRNDKAGITVYTTNDHSISIVDHDNGKADVRRHMGLESRGTPGGPTSSADTPASTGASPPASTGASLNGGTDDRTGARVTPTGATTTPAEPLSGPEAVAMARKVEDRVDTLTHDLQRKYAETNPLAAMALKMIREDIHDIADGDPRARAHLQLDQYLLQMAAPGEFGAPKGTPPMMAPETPQGGGGGKPAKPNPKGGTTVGGRTTYTA